MPFFFKKEVIGSLAWMGAIRAAGMGDPLAGPSCPFAGASSAIVALERVSSAGIVLDGGRRAASFGAGGGASA